MSLLPRVGPVKTVTNVDYNNQVTKKFRAVFIRHKKQPTKLLNTYFILRNNHHWYQLQVPN